jgi:glycosyltransferase involved in cell wall biosynthesis
LPYFLEYNLGVISLVITTYNRANFLPKAIDSVLGQTYADFELIIWDDGSEDGSLEIARRYAAKDSRLVLVEAPHLGRGKALRFALERARGEYLGWVDSDDFLERNALSETVAVLDANPDLGMVYTDYSVIDCLGRIRGLGSRCSIPYSKERLLVDFMTFHFRLIRRSVYDAIGGVNAEYGTIEDYELCLRLSEVTKIARLPQSLYFYRVHDESISALQQVKQVELTSLAISEALSRRGLSDRVAVEVKLNPKFFLRSLS